MVEGLPRIGLFTNKFIERGTMLSRDYVSGAGSEAEGEKCLCGEACCNGFFENTSFLIPEFILTVRKSKKVFFL